MCEYTSSSEQHEENPNERPLTPGEKIAVQFLQEYAALREEGDIEGAFELERSVHNLLPGIYSWKMYRKTDLRSTADQESRPPVIQREGLQPELENIPPHIIVYEAFATYSDLLRFGEYEKAQLYKEEILALHPDLQLELSEEFDTVDLTHTAFPFYPDSDIETDPIVIESRKKHIGKWGRKINNYYDDDADEPEIDISSDQNRDETED